MPRKSGRPSRFKPRAYKRWRAARTIGRAWRRRRKRTYRSASQRTSNVSLGRRAKHLTLAKRVKRLEISAKKHYDYVHTRLPGLVIQAPGVDNGTLTQESFSQLLAIQPRNLNADIPPVSGSARGSERNTREGMEVFATKCRLRGRISGITASSALAVRTCLFEYVDAVTTTIHQITPLSLQSQVRQACQSRVHIIVCADRRASTIDPVTGLYEPNPLPVLPQNVLQGFYQNDTLSTNNTLDTMGLDAALRNYTNNRFKVVHKSTLQFDYLHPTRWFDINININKKLIFQPPNPNAQAQGNSDPVNYNLVVFFSSVPAETQKVGAAEFIMPDVSTSPYTPTPLLVMPTLEMMSSRTYFRET